jgi:hypothetical protein
MAGRDAVLRLFAFRAARTGFDEILRTQLIPDLLEQPGIERVYVGRQGPDETGPRLVASVWADRDTMMDALGADLGRFHPELLDETADRTLEILSVVLEEQFEVEGTAKILRLLRGRVRDGEFAAYVEDVRRGTEVDVRDERGPVTLDLATDGVDAFVTMSAWRSWHDIELATGGDIHQPRATRHPERLVAWDVAHYEIVRAG